MNIDNCSFKYQLGTTIVIYPYRLINISIVHSSFESNSRNLVLHERYRYNSVAMFHMSHCKITSTQGYSFSFVFQNDNQRTIFKSVIMNNYFYQNKDTIISLDDRPNEAHKSEIDITIKNNTFTNNTALTPGSGMLKFSGYVRLVQISKNDFQKNNCTFIWQYISWKRSNETFVRFVNNSVEENYGFPGDLPVTRYTNVSNSAIDISGCLAVPNVFINHNTLNNHQMDAEIFIGGGCGTNYNRFEHVIDARYNWWGTSDATEIRNRIFDFEDWNDRAKVTFLPASASRKFDSLFETSAVKHLNFLERYINPSMRLIIENSPYIVRKDLTVDQNFNLTIDPGVELYFYPNVGLLIMGNLFATGSFDKPIKLCSFAKKCSAGMVTGTLRLIGGSSRYDGRLEIFDDKKWKVPCSNYFNLPEAKVACKELGLGNVERLSSRNSRIYLRADVWRRSLHCTGNEASLFDCKSTPSYYRHCYYDVYLSCKPSGKWGNVRITSSTTVLSSVSSEEHQSVLENVHIDDSSVLHNDKYVSSIQIINRSALIKNVKLTSSNGIEIISPMSSTKIENVTINGTYWSHGITILGNQKTVEVIGANVLSNWYGGIVIAPMNNLTLHQPYNGLPDLCDPSFTIFVNNTIYLYYRGNHMQQTTRFCSKQFSSPENTTIAFRFLRWPILTSTSSKVGIYDGSSSTSTQIAVLHRWNNNYPKDKEFKSSSNSMFVHVTSHQFNDAFIAEIKALNKTGNMTVFVRIRPC